LGREVTSLSPFGRGLNLSEKQWASGGDSFIGVLTSRDISIIGNERMPPSWTHTESGLTFEADRPIMAFLEYGVRADGIYANLEDCHIIRFNPLRPYSDLILSKNKIMNFRQECSGYRSKKAVDVLVDVGKTVFSAVGIAVILGSFFGDDR
jgi:hypothetical protein